MAAPSLTVLRLQADHVVRLLDSLREGLMPHAGDFVEVERYRSAMAFLASSRSMAHLLRKEIEAAGLPMPASLVAALKCVPVTLTDAEQVEQVNGRA